MWHRYVQGTQPGHDVLPGGLTPYHRVTCRQLVPTRTFMLGEIPAVHTKWWGNPDCSSGFTFPFMVPLPSPRFQPIPMSLSIVKALPRRLGIRLYSGEGTPFGWQPYS